MICTFYFKEGTVKSASFDDLIEEKIINNISRDRTLNDCHMTRFIYWNIGILEYWNIGILECFTII